MPHSLAQTAEITCSQCQTAFSADVWLVVDGGERPDLLARLREGELHTLVCPHCGHTGAVDAPVLVYLPAASLPAGGDEAPLLLFSPAQATSAAEDEEHAAGLTSALAAALGDAWDDAWLEQGATVPRQALLAVLGDDLRGALAELQRQMQAAAEVANQPPLVRTLLAFVFAPNEETARQVFDQQRALLQPYEAQRMLGQFAEAADDAEQAEILGERSRLLRMLRGAGPAAPPDASATPAAQGPPLAPVIGTGFDNRSVRAGAVVQAAGSAYHQSAHAEAGGTATVTNITVHNVGSLPKRWTRPTPPPLGDRAVPRPQEMEDVGALIRQRASVAIGGKVTSVGVQGMPGVGKTTLALLVAHRLEKTYAGGVLWTDVGPDVRTPADSQRLLDGWAGYCVGPIDPAELARMSFDPAAVRSLLAEQGPLLAVLDNVWSLAAVKPLRDALPASAYLLITTRSKTVMYELGGGRYELDVLALADARALAAERLGAGLVTDAAGPPWLDALIEGVGRHPLALDVALGILLREGSYGGEWAASCTRILERVRSGRDLGALRLEEEDREHNVEAVLAISYEALEEESRRRLRTLGAFALEAPFSTALAAAVWGCEEEPARRQLVDFANAALLTRIDEGTWRQHALLRGYALALLHKEGEYDEAAYHHTLAYGEAMRVADDAQRPHTMLDSLPQLRHAFAWAIAADLNLAQDLIANCENLMAVFGLTRELVDWCRQVLQASQNRGSLTQIGRAQGSLGNALGRLVEIAGEDRRGRLYEALAAYDEALRYYTPEAAPLAYAMAQNNRANILSELAGLVGEDRRGRLYAALAAYDEALRFHTPSAAPLDYATAQNNRANRLSELAGLAGEDRRERLYEALAAHDEALLYRTPEAAPLDYAMTQNNRAIILSDLAELAGEDRRARLYEALAAYDAALLYRTPVAAPLDYARTQHNRGPILRALAELSREDRRGRLYAALAAYDEALRFYTPEAAPLAYAMTQHNRGLVFSDLAGLDGEDRRTRLAEALTVAWEALALFVQYQHDQYAQVCARMLKSLRTACGADFAELWQSLGVGNPPAWLLEDKAQEDARPPLLVGLAAYAQLRKAAGENESDAGLWRQAAKVGEALLAMDWADLTTLAPDLPPDFRAGFVADLANMYNQLGYILDDAKDAPGALAAFERAVALQPDFAMWRRNLASTLIDLGRLDEAAAALEMARTLEPDAPRLAELDTQLAAARAAGEPPAG